MKSTQGLQKIKKDWIEKVNKVWWKKKVEKKKKKEKKIVKRQKKLKSNQNLGSKYWYVKCNLIINYE